MNANDWVNDRIGTPWVSGGRDYSAFDCYGLVILFYRDVLGIQLPDWEVTGKSKTWILKQFVDAHSTVWKKSETPANGDIVGVFSPDGVPFHVGLLWNGKMFHSQKGVNCVLHDMRRFTTVYPNIEIGRITCQP
jgi:cell wall-associated NlpC family hydrolase